MKLKGYVITMITIRPWNILDAEFMLKCRNNKALMRWYRQDKKLTLKWQREFIKTGSILHQYNCYIVEYGIGKPVGFVAYSHILNDTAEFSIGILPKYQGKGYAKAAMESLESLVRSKNLRGLYSEVFVDNPALGFYLKLGYKITNVKERAYYKRNVGMVDVVRIEKCLS